MHQSGLDVKSIAKYMKWDVDVIQEWVKEK